MLQRFTRSTRRAGRRPRAHLIHIGKTAGTALKWALDPVAGSGGYELRLHDHQVTLRDVPPGDRVFFALREPIDRFVSGFNSRQRQGRPRYHYPWSPQEQTAFRTFASADSLAAALSSDDHVRKAAAVAAMSSIQHVRDSYWRWFDSPGYFTGRLEDVLLILWVPTLAQSFAQLRGLLGVGDEIALPVDDVSAHRSPAGIDTTIGEAARANLRSWYASDYAFLELCAAQPAFAPNAATTHAGAGMRSWT